MGSPLGPTLVNVFLCHYEKEWLDNCPIHFKLMIYKRYVDASFVLFSTREYFQCFLDYMNKQHKCLKCTSWSENDKSFMFLDIEITCHNQQFKTSVYRKPTFSVVFILFNLLRLHFISFRSWKFKRNLKKRIALHQKL